MHWSGEITLGTLVSAAALLLAVGALFLRLGSLQAMLLQLVEEGKIVARELQASNDRLTLHQNHDENLFREMSATLNQIVGKIGSK